MHNTEQAFSFKRLFVPITTLKAVHWLILIGLVVFCNSLFNEFVLEDRAVVVRNISIRSLSAIPHLFVSQVGGQETITYYRPLLFSFYTLLYTVFQQNTFAYHAIQLMFQIANAILLFLIFKKFLNLGIAFFCSLLFLVHPINEEVVVWIANLQDVSFIFFGLLALYLLQKYNRGVKHIIFANLCLLLSLFSKETGVLFFVIAVLYVSLFQKQKLGKQILFSFCVGLFYVILRFISQTPFDKQPLVPIMTLSFWERMMSVPAIICYYLITFFYPKNLVVYHSWIIHKIQFTTFYMPLLFDILFFTLLFLGCWYAITKGSNAKTIVFFFSWFVIGIIFHLQIFPIDFTVADHFFIFSCIGLIALLGCIFQSINMTKAIKKGVLAIAIVIILVLSLRTIVRNTNWVDQTTLLTHDEKVAPNDYLLELVYSTELIQENNKEAMLHVQRALSLYPGSWLAWNSLGVVYFQKGDVIAAKKAYAKSIALEKNFGAYENMGLLLLKQGDLKTAKDFIQNANVLFPTSWKLWYYRVIVEDKIGTHANALLAAKYYYLLNPTDQSYALYSSLSQNKPVDRKL